MHINIKFFKYDREHKIFTANLSDFKFTFKLREDIVSMGRKVKGISIINPVNGKVGFFVFLSYESDDSKMVFVSNEADPDNPLYEVYVHIYKDIAI